MVNKITMHIIVLVFIHHLKKKIIFLMAMFLVGNLLYFPTATFWGKRYFSAPIKDRCLIFFNENSSNHWVTILNSFSLYVVCQQKLRYLDVLPSKAHSYWLFTHSWCNKQTHIILLCTKIHRYYLWHEASLKSTEVLVVHPFM